MADLTVGARTGSPRGTGAVRAGVLEAGIGYWSVTPFERRALAAVAAAHSATGAPATVHLEHGSAAFEVLEILGAHRAAPESVAPAHMDRNPAPGLPAELCASGAFVGYDGMDRHRERPDSALIACLVAVVDQVGPARILLGGDVAPGDAGTGPSAAPVRATAGGGCRARGGGCDAGGQSGGVAALAPHLKPLHRSGGMMGEEWR
ncbi:hypothetical protein GCM10027570_14510 [Streptomonospora sediminis]